MAGVLSRILFEKYPAIYTAERFHLYRGGIYSEVTDYEIENIIRDHLIEKYAKTNDINDAVNQWRLRIFKDAKGVNTNKDLLNLSNGLFDIRTGTILPHTKNYLSTIRICASYDPNAQCPNFQAFLNQILEAELVPVVQEIFGYILSNCTEAQKAFIFYGVPRSGKSTLIKLIEDVVGLNNCSHISLQGLSDRFSPSELYGKLLNSFSDLPNKAIEDLSLFKNIVGADVITVERKNRPHFSFKPTVKLLLSANSMPPSLNDKNDGFYRRLLIVRFLKQVEIGRIITDLAEQLLEERDGIFKWAIEGLQRLICNNFQFSNASAVNEEINKYKLNQSSALLFVEEECDLSPNYSVRREELYTFYCDYCRYNGLKCTSKAHFNEAIESEFAGKIMKSNESYSRISIWKGVRHSLLAQRKDATDYYLDRFNEERSS